MYHDTCHLLIYRVQLLSDIGLIRLLSPGTSTVFLYVIIVHVVHVVFSVSRQQTH